MNKRIRSEGKLRRAKTRRNTISARVVEAPSKPMQN